MEYGEINQGHQAKHLVLVRAQGRPPGGKASPYKRPRSITLAGQDAHASTVSRRRSLDTLRSIGGARPHMPAEGNLQPLARSDDSRGIVADVRLAAEWRGADLAFPTGHRRYRAPAVTACCGHVPGIRRRFATVRLHLRHLSNLTHLQVTPVGIPLLSMHLPLRKRS